MLLQEAMFPKFVVFLLFVKQLLASPSGNSINTSAFFNTNGTAEITVDGLKILIDADTTGTETTSQADADIIGRKTTFQARQDFYSVPLRFKNTTNGDVFSFSTNFIFAIHPQYPSMGGHGMAFVISPSNNLIGAQPDQYLGLFNKTNDGLPSNHIVAIELDIIKNLEFEDIDDNHVGVDINGLKSNKSAPAAYFSDENGGFKNLSLRSGDPMQISIEYDGLAKQLNVTLFPINVSKPHLPLLSLHIDLSPIILDNMYVGFAASTGILTASHCVLGWSFCMVGKAQELNTSSLPTLPWKQESKNKSKDAEAVRVPLLALVCVLVSISVTIFVNLKRLISAQVVEDWELEYGTHRIAYEDLNEATNGFADKQLLGRGGFGRVYKGILPNSKTKVAVKRISHESHQGINEFIAEIVSLGRLRHRNLVPLRGYCRHKGELLLVYELMPKGSLDKVIFDQPKSSLNWGRRFRIIKGVASGLVYLHEEWEQVVLHRDIKSSNVMLDSELQGRLGDFGLARLHQHGTDLQTTHVVGTLGYLAPELTRTGKATTSTDVFAFGIFMLEVACGRRPIESRAPPGELILADWVLDCWRKGAILDSADAKLGDGYAFEEMELVLKLGLLCSHPLPKCRPSMRQVMQFLDGDVSLPELSPDGFTICLSGLEHGNVSFIDLIKPDQSVIMESVLSGGR
ncbi:L-type lectin-domain-containing protein [Cinnamomum micranthum f. kanehirae]|uniref:non-specific serine/threonine protein kinase n=1 Tax=Cinnamomum micranthum f. kanehirae TaxID=337451 RepID=A0A3S3MHX6_9MAGN|nr:L-type lectin-domain-containing protein [Cinnamomum micranthum f. kanehirae]